MNPVRRFHPFLSDEVALGHFAAMTEIMRVLGLTYEITTNLDASPAPFEQTGEGIRMALSTGTCARRHLLVSPWGASTLIGKGLANVDTPDLLRVLSSNGVELHTLAFGGDRLGRFELKKAGATVLPALKELLPGHLANAQLLKEHWQILLNHRDTQPTC